MKERLRELISSTGDLPHHSLLVREYLQSRLLGFLQHEGAMIPLAFQGGTALRLLYGLDRFSEDLDFALERADDYDLAAYVVAIERGLRAETYDLEVRVDARRPIHTAWVRFPGLLFVLGLSGDPRQKIAVKIEVDTHPPAGAELATTVVRRHGLLNLQHYDRSSLLAGKLHAVMARPFPKGRDYYDLMWYLADPSWPEPNIEFLGNALRQTRWPGALPTLDSWRADVLRRVESVEWPSLRRDVEPLIENPTSLQAFQRANLVRLLQARAPLDGA
jgi:predicted nucleotidyltransferase component of viral defense system